MNKSKHYSISTLVGGICLLATIATACSKGGSEEYYTPQPGINGEPIENPSQVVVTPPTESTDGTTLPAEGTTTTITDEQGNSMTIGGSSTDVEAGTYTLTSVNGTNGTQVIGTPDSPAALNGTVLTANTSTDGEVVNLPEIYGGTTQFTATANSSVMPEVVMNPLTREVVLSVQLSGIDPEQVSQAECALYGVQATTDLTAPHFARSSSRAGEGTLYVKSIATSFNADGTFEIRFRLFGIADSAEQQVRIILTMKDSSSSNYQEVVTSHFKGFNTGIATTPVKLNAVINFGLNGISGDINPWKPGLDDDLKGE